MQSPKSFPFSSEDALEFTGGTSYLLRSTLEWPVTYVVAERASIATTVGGLRGGLLDGDQAYGFMCCF
jgi:hypothetical protein